MFFQTLLLTQFPYWKRADCPPQVINFCNMRWYGCFLSSNNITDVKPREHTRNVNLKYITVQV